MVATKEGNKKTAAKNRAKYGNDFWKRIGRLGGKKYAYGGGFASEIDGKDGLTGRERARIAGAKGGKKSRRRSKHDAG